MDFEETGTAPPVLADPAADAAAEARLIEAWAAMPSACALLHEPAWGPVLRASHALSPHLAGLLQRHPDIVVQVAREGPAAAVATALAAMAPAGLAADPAAAMAPLRHAKQQAALAIALADLAGLWPVERVCAALSEVAEAAITHAANVALRRQARAGRLTLDPKAADLAPGSGLIVLGMGKLGGGELNYSSDVDLVILYDEEIAPITAADQLSATFTRVARDIAALLAERTADGYVFRCDYRLRPDPGVSPPALSVGTAEIYYGSLAETWERAALLKARPVGGDRAAGAAFLRLLAPWIWRRHLDFAALAELRAVRQRLRAHHGDGLAVPGHDVKLGRGGIRAIEFFVQAHQLVFGGREPALRHSATLPALAALVAAGRVEPQTARQLGAAYRRLRVIEHRLQMVDDRQTHAWPQAEAPRRQVAALAGAAELATIEAELAQLFARVDRLTDGIFNEAAPEGPALDLRGEEGQDAPLEASLVALGFTDPADAIQIVRGWFRGRHRSLRTQRARGLIAGLQSPLLSALAATAAPDEALRALDRLFERLPAGVPLLELLARRAEARTVLARVLGTAPALSEHMSRHPELLDGVLLRGFRGTLPSREQLEADLADLLAPLPVGEALEPALDAVRRFAKDRRFQVGVQMLEGRADGWTAGPFLADLAQATLAALWPRVEAHLAAASGRVPGGRFAVLGLGRIGGRHMTLGSDLDLITVYDAPDGAEADGPQRLSPSVWYARATQRLVAAVTAPTAEGKLYDIDLRLRPSGQKGPLATSLPAFLAYQEGEAWTWEHMALTRARPLLGDPVLCERLRGAIAEIVRRPRDLAQVLADATAMRQRLERERRPKTPWAVKHWPGGLVDVEFTVQALVLAHAAARPDLFAPTMQDAILALGDAGWLGRLDAQILTDVLMTATRVQGFLRLATFEAPDPDRLAPAFKQALVESVFPGESLDFAGAEARLAAQLAAARAVADRLIYQPGAAHLAAAGLSEA